MQHAVTQSDRRPSIDRRSDRRSPREADLVIGQWSFAQNLRERFGKKSMEGDHGSTIQRQCSICNLCIGLKIDYLIIGDRRGSAPSMLR